MEKFDPDRLINADKALKALGTWGRYQVCIFVLSCSPWTFVAFQMMSIAFTGATPPFDCRPTTDGLNLTDLSSLNASYYQERCELNTTEEGPQSCGSDGKSQFIYGTEEFGQTINSEWNLICESSVMSKVASSSFFLGKLLGSLIFPGLADRYGRRWFILGCSWSLGLVGVFVAFSPGYWYFVVLRLLTGAMAAGSGLSSWVLTCEVVVPSKRNYGVTGQGVFWTAGYCLVGVYAYFLRDWRQLQIALSLSSAVLLVYYWLIPESLHWYVAMKQNDKAWEWIQKAAKFNKRVVQPSAIYDSNDNDGKERHKRNICDVGKSPVLLVQTAIMAYLWFINTAFYYGLSLFTTELAGDRFVNYILSGIVELPAYFLLNPMLAYFGRRLTISGYHVLAAVALLILMFIPRTLEDGTSLQLVITALWLIGKFSISSSFMGVWLYGAEIFPTTLRTSGLGVSNMAARLGGITAPFAGMLNEAFGSERAVPSVFGCLSLVAAALTLLLPETAGKDLPEDIYEIDYGLLGACFTKKVVKHELTTVVDTAEMRPLVKDVNQTNVL